MKHVIALLAVYALVSSPAAAEGFAPDWRFAHPNSAMVGYVNLRSIMSSQAVQTIFTDAQSRMQQQGLPIANLDAMKDMFSEVESVSISMTGGATGDALVFIRGQFNSGRLQQMLAQGKGGPSVRPVPGGLLIGQPAALSAAVRRIAAPPTVRATELALQARGSGSLDLWFSGDAAALPPPKNTAAAGKELLDQLAGFSIGMRIQDPPSFSVELTGKSDEAADTMMALFFKAQDEMMATPEIKKEWDKLARNLKVDRQGARVSIRVTGDVGQTALSGLATQVIGKRTAAAPEQPARKTIIIHGLDNGPKEIPLVK